MTPGKETPGRGGGPGVEVRFREDYDSKSSGRAALPQWARRPVKRALVALGVRGLIAPATALRLLRRWRLTGE